MTITRMQEPRQLYGLGSLVKKITKPIKKIVKSPIGKAALLGAAAFGIPGTSIGGLFGRAGFGGAAKGLLGNFGLAQTLGMTGLSPGAMGGKSPGIFSALKRGFGNLSTGTKFALGAGVTSLLAASGMGEAEIEETKRDPDKLRVYLKDYFSKLNPNASDAEIEEFVETNVSEYATGGRVGFKDGKNMKMASGPDLEDSRNDMANQMFGKDLRLLTEEELEALQIAENMIVNEEVSLQAACDWLEYKTGRSISTPGLKKHIDKKYGTRSERLGNQSASLLAR